MEEKTELPDIDHLTIDELRAVVHAQHETIRAIVADNNAFSTYQEKGNQIWARQVNSRLSALFEAFNHPDKIQ
ncbi:MAG: hypothetical protein WDM94_09755 [Bauldia sp.]